MHTFEIACALRAPTLRAHAHNTRKSPWQADRADQFIGRELHLLVVRVKVRVRHAPFAARRNENQFRFVGQQRGKRIRRGRSIHDIAAERAAILVRDSAGPARRASQQRKFATATISFSRRSVYVQPAPIRISPGRRFDPPQFGKIPDAQQLSRAQAFPRQTAPSRPCRPRSAAMRRALARAATIPRRKVRRGNQFVFGRIGSHVQRRRRAASATASKICM